MIAAEPLSAEDLAGLDPGIVDAVVWLRAHGFDTTDSGDGASKFVDAPPDEIDVDATLAVMRDETAPAEGRIAAADALISRAFPGPAPVIGPDWRGCAIPRPNVAIHVAPADLVAECNRLRDLLESTGARVEALGPEDTDAVEIQGSYDPGDGHALILLLGFTLPAVS